jgi:hypothetical protein
MCLVPVCRRPHRRDYQRAVVVSVWIDLREGVDLTIIIWLILPNFLNLGVITLTIRDTLFIVDTVGYSLVSLRRLYGTGKWWGGGTGHEEGNISVANPEP